MPINYNQLHRELKFHFEQKLADFLTPDEFAQVTVKVAEGAVIFEAPSDIHTKITEWLKDKKD